MLSTQSIKNKGHGKRDDKKSWAQQRIFTHNHADDADSYLKASHAQKGLINTLTSIPLGYCGSSRLTSLFFHNKILHYNNLTTTDRPTTKNLKERCVFKKTRLCGLVALIQTRYTGSASVTSGFNKKKQVVCFEKPRNVTSVLLVYMPGLIH